MAARKDSGNGRETERTGRRGSAARGTARADRTAEAKADRAAEAKSDRGGEGVGAARLDSAGPQGAAGTNGIRVEPAAGSGPGSPLPVELTPTSWGSTADQNLWTLIRNRTDAVNFQNYSRFIDDLLARRSHEADSGGEHPRNGGYLTLLGTDGYDFVRWATECFLMNQVGLLVQDYFEQLDRHHPAAERTAESLQPGYDRSWVASGEDQSEFLRRSNRPLPGHWLVELRDQYLQRLGVNAPTKVLPYLKIIMDGLSDLPLKAPTEVVGDSYGVEPGRLVGPLGIELLWVYWHEEGMVQQTFNTIIRRFQNLPNIEHRPDPLARFELGPLRPLNNMLWGWIQNKGGVLSVRRRAYEYDHQYGITLLGQAAGTVRGVDSRSQFISAFHNLLHLCTEFYQQDDDLTVQSDGFPLLNALQETQLVVTAGADNQYGDLPWTARVETLMQLWMLGRPEMREFLGGRPMVPYKEHWMDRVDTMKSMMDWSDVNVTHFRDLGVFGEQILLSIRYGGWATQISPAAAVNWARYWRPEIQGYIHAYRAVTGADLRQGVNTAMPGELLAARSNQIGSATSEDAAPSRRLTFGRYTSSGRSARPEPDELHNQHNLS
jgi:hypothetical protein